MKKKTRRLIGYVVICEDTLPCVIRKRGDLFPIWEAAARFHIVKSKREFRNLVKKSEEIEGHTLTCFEAVPVYG